VYVSRRVTTLDSLYVNRVSQSHWHALYDHQVIGRGEVFRRPDGRQFLSIDVWHDDAFGRLAEAMLSALPRPLYTVATRSGRYLGLIRVTHVLRRPRIGLIAVRADERRRGVARALLGHTLGSLHERGIEQASAELNESNTAALALFDRFGARRVGSNLELVLR
jgi:ribosomal protein S18 acetylase RimI-like enzyme